MPLEEKINNLITFFYVKKNIIYIYIHLNNFIYNLICILYFIIVKTNIIKGLDICKVSDKYVGDSVSYKSRTKE